MDIGHDTDIKNELIERNGFDQRCRCYRAKLNESTKKKVKKEKNTLKMIAKLE